MKYCRGPVNRLLMMRAKGINGPFFQHTTPGTCVKSAGNYWAPGMPGAQVYIISAKTTDSGGNVSQNHVTVCWSGLPDAVDYTVGADITINGVPATITGASTTDDCITYTITETIDIGDDVRFILDNSGETWIDPGSGDPIKDQNYPVENLYQTVTVLSAVALASSPNTIRVTFSEAIKYTSLLGQKLTRDPLGAPEPLTIEAPLTVTGESTVDYTVTEDIYFGDVLEWSYTEASGDIVSLVSGVALADAVVPVDNQIPELGIVSAVLAVDQTGQYVDIQFDTFVTGQDFTGWTLYADGDLRAITSGELINGSTAVRFRTTGFTSANTVTWNYDPVTGNGVYTSVEHATYEFTDQPVVNQIPGARWDQQGIEWDDGATFWDGGT